MCVCVWCVFYIGAQRVSSTCCKLDAASDIGLTGTQSQNGASKHFHTHFYYCPSPLYTHHTQSIPSMSVTAHRVEVMFVFACRKASVMRMCLCGGK